MNRNPTRRSLPFRGRPHSSTTLRSLDDGELEAELTIAACAPGNRRSARYDALLAERARRRRAGAGKCQPS